MPRQTYFNPGCALSIYKPKMENKILSFFCHDLEDFHPAFIRAQRLHAQRPSRNSRFYFCVGRFADQN
jgi:hypothetical protein